MTQSSDSRWLHGGVWAQTSTSVCSHCCAQKAVFYLFVWHCCRATWRVIDSIFSSSPQLSLQSYRLPVLRVTNILSTAALFYSQKNLLWPCSELLLWLSLLHSTYRISLIRRCGYYIFHCSVLWCYYSRVAGVYLFRMPAVMNNGWIRYIRHVQVMRWWLLDTVSSMRSLSILLSAMEKSFTTRTARPDCRQKYSRMCVCVLVY